MQQCYVILIKDGDVGIFWGVEMKSRIAKKILSLKDRAMIEHRFNYKFELLVSTKLPQIRKHVMTVFSPHKN